MGPGSTAALSCGNWSEQSSPAALFLAVLRFYLAGNHSVSAPLIRCMIGPASRSDITVSALSYGFTSDMALVWAKSEER